MDVKTRIEVIDPESHPNFQKYVNAFVAKRNRHGVTLEDAEHTMKFRNYFAGMMVDQGDADVSLSGLTTNYPDTIKPALHTIGVKAGVKKVSGLYVLILQDRTFFFADTTVNIDPSAENLAEIALLSADTAKLFGIQPRVAMISFSNFGSTVHPSTNKVRDAVKIVRQRRPDLECDGEMQADTAVLPEFLKENYPWTELKGPGERPRLPRAPERERGVQARLAAREGGGDRADPHGDGQARPRPSARRRGLRHREHGGVRRRGRAVPQEVTPGPRGPPVPYDAGRVDVLTALSAALAAFAAVPALDGSCAGGGSRPRRGARERRRAPARPGRSSR